MSEHDLDVVVVGAGWAGMSLLHHLRGRGLNVKVVEAGDSVGGTWYWNRYPGARCDSPSIDYSYGFSDELQQEWCWSERYAPQPEIERYLNHVADRFDLRRDIVFGTRVLAASYDAASAGWVLQTSAGTDIRARFCVLATGTFSAPVRPDIKGFDSFEGEVYFTAQWPSDPVSFDGKKVGVVGTGSSGCQVITAVGQQPIERLTVFQRTPAWVVPALNRPTDPEAEREFKKQYAEYRRRARQSGFGIPFALELGGPTSAMSDEEFEARMDAAYQIGGAAILGACPDMLHDPAASARVGEYVLARMRERIEDPETAAKLLPTDSIGARRAVYDNRYLETYNDERVTLVDVKATPIEEILPTGVRTSTDTYDLDVLIFATGFDSGTGAMLRMAITGEHGASLSDVWSAGPRTYLGLMVDGFPNLFMVTGPGSPSVRSHAPVAIEQHVEWITDLVAGMNGAGQRTVAPSTEATDAWSAHVADLASRTVFVDEYSQYWGSNVPGKPRVYLAYMGGVGNYGKVCDEVRDHGYAGFVFDDDQQQAAGHEALSWTRSAAGSGTFI